MSAEAIAKGGTWNARRFENALSNPKASLTTS